MNEVSGRYDDVQETKFLLKPWLVAVSKHLFLACLLVIMSCLLPFFPLTMLFGFVFGIGLVNNTYVEVKHRMTWMGDVILFLTIAVLVAMIALFMAAFCQIPSDRDACIQSNLLNACVFLFSFPMCISAFSLWLTFRFRQMRRLS